MNTQELIAALEAAEGPSRALDGKIDFHRNGFMVDQCKPYTSSIDAALTLVPEGSECDLNIRRKENSVAVRPNTIGKLYIGWHKHLAIALVIAALKARAEMEERG